MKKHTILSLILSLSIILLFTGCTQAEISQIQAYGGVHIQKISTTIGRRIPTNIQGFKLQFKVVNEGTAPLPEKNSMIEGLPLFVEGVVCLISPNKAEWNITGKVCKKYIFKRGMKVYYTKDGKISKIEPETFVIDLPEGGLMKPPKEEFSRTITSITLKNCYSYFTYGVVTGCLLINPSKYEEMEKVCGSLRLANISIAPLEIKSVEQVGPAIVNEDGTVKVVFIVELSKRRAEDQIYDINELLKYVKNGKCPGTLYPSKIDAIRGDIYIATADNSIIGKGRCIQNDPSNPLLFTCTVDIKSLPGGKTPDYIPISLQLIFSYGIINIEKLQEVELLPISKGALI